MKERSASSNQSGSNSNLSTTATSTDQQNSGVVVDQQTALLNPNNFMAPPLGGIVKCTTCLKNTLQGKVVAYDQQTKMLALRTPVPNKPGYYDFSMINVAWCSDLEVVEEPSEPLEPLINLNSKKLERRQKLNIDNKYKEINSLGQDVCPLAQHIFFSIYKTLEDVEWDDQKIVVMKSVIIKPPYDVNSVQGKNGDNHQAVEHVKKIVKKVNDEFSSQNTAASSN